MIKSDIPELAKRLEELVEVYGARAIGAAGLKVWHDALAGVGMPDILSALTDWPKTASKMPAPADIRRLATERRLEYVAKQDAAQKADQRAFSHSPRTPPNSPVAKAAFAEIKSILSGSSGGPVAGTWMHVGGNPNMDPKGWAKKLRQRQADGEVLSYYQEHMLRGMDNAPPRAVMLDEEEPTGWSS